MTEEHTTVDRLGPEVLPWFVRAPQHAIDCYKAHANYVVLDFETTNISNGLAIFPENKLVLAVWYVVKDGKVTKKYKFADEYGQQELLDDIKVADFIVAHNIKFEFQWLARCGLDCSTVLGYDTMLAEWVIAGNRKVLFNLEATSKRYGFDGKGSIVSKLIKMGTCPSTIPQSWLLSYCDKDVDLCHKVMLKQLVVLEENNLLHIVLQRNLVAPVLADIETKGLQLDAERVNVEYEKLKEIVYRLGEELDQITEGINLNSPKQLGKFLYKTLGFPTPSDNAGKPMMTESGSISTSVIALAKLTPRTPVQLRFLELYKEYNLSSSMLSKNMEFFKRVCDEKGGVFYGQLNHCRTANHRLASSGVKMRFKGMKKDIAAQIQNLPRRYKGLFTAHDDRYVVTEYDGSQIEFRVGGDISSDPIIEYDIVNGVDIHSFTMNTMNTAYTNYGIQKELDRQAAKPNTFAPIIV